MYEEKKFEYSLHLREMINQIETNAEFDEIVKNNVKYLTEYNDYCIVIYRNITERAH